MYTIETTIGLEDRSFILYEKESTMNVKKLMDRRSFLRGTVAAASAAVALPTIVPATVFGARAPSNRIAMGAIGVGSQGTGDMRGFLDKSESAFLPLPPNVRGVTQLRRFIQITGIRVRFHL